MADCMAHKTVHTGQTTEPLYFSSAHHKINYTDITSIQLFFSVIFFLF